MKTFVEIDVVDVQETSLRYHVGLPAEVRIDELKQILKLYEKYGFTEELFTKIAEENGHDLDDYSYNGGYSVNNETTGNTCKFMCKPADKFRLYRGVGYPCSMKNK